MNKMKMSFAVLLAFLTFTTAFAKTNLERVEPAFWWVGMNNPNLQLMVYGEDISSLRPSVNYEGVKLVQSSAVESPNYLFLDLVIAENAKAGKFNIDFKNAKGKVVHSYEYELLNRDKTEITGFTSEDVLYLITPDRFANGDASNDTVEGLKEGVNREKLGGRHGGDIQGLIDNLDYIDEMGFTAVWINPMLENDMEEYSYHGYSTTDFYKVDSRYGSNALYKEFIAEGHKRGIKTIMDMILNHIGSEHWWMSDLPTSDWINFGGEYVNTNHLKPALLDPYGSEYDLKHYTDGWFVSTMPDMNVRNKFLATYLIQNTIWWIEYARLDGIRMDTYSYPDKYFMADWTCRVMEEYPAFNIVGEEWKGNPAYLSYWQKGKVNHDGYTSCLPSLMDFALQESLVKSLNGQGWYAFAPSYETLAEDYHYADPFNLVIFPDNHDMARFYDQIGHDFDKFKMGIAYTLTMRGIPQLYYGTEILASFPDAENPSDHGLLRYDFPGGWDGDGVNAFTGNGLTADQKEAQEYTKKLLNWRKTSKAVHAGKLMHFARHQDVYVFFRYTADEKVMTVLSMNDKAVDLDLSVYGEILEGETSGKDVVTATNFDLTGKTIKVPAKGALVLEVK